METVVLVVLLLLALVLIVVVLLQRSEGGGLGMGTGGLMTGRAQATALGKLTWWLGGAFMAASLALTIIAAERAATSSVVDQIRGTPAPAPGAPTLGEGADLLPPPAAETPATVPLVPTGE